MGRAGPNHLADSASFEKDSALSCLAACPPSSSINLPHNTTTSLKITEDDKQTESSTHSIPHRVSQLADLSLLLSLKLCIYLSFFCIVCVISAAVTFLELLKSQPAQGRIAPRPNKTAEGKEGLSRIYVLPSRCSARHAVNDSSIGIDL